MAASSFRAWHDASRDLTSAIERYLNTSIDLENKLSLSADSGLTCQNLEELASAVRIDQEAAKSWDHMLKRAKFSLNRVHNRSTKLVPINSLPLEILVRIFVLASDECLFSDNKSSTLGFPSAKMLLPLTQVCTDWRRLCISTSVLWTHLDLVDHGTHSTESKLMGLWLERTGNRPLQFHVSINHNRNSPHALGSLVQLLPYMGRTTSLFLESTRSYRLIQRALLLWLNESSGSVCTLSLLGSINMSSNHKEYLLTSKPSPQPSHFDSILAPVRVLRLHHLAFEWTSSVYHGLIHLELSRVPENVSPTLHQMFNILSACPNLRTLKLVGLPILYPEDELSNFIPVVLDDLELLDVLEMSQVHLSHLLDMLAPGSQELSVRIRFQDDSQSAKAILSFFARSNITKLYVKTYAPTPLIVKYLASLKRLRMLALDFILPQIVRCNSVLNALATPQQPGSADHSSICPDMRALWLINAAFDLGHIQRVVEAHGIERLRLTSVTQPPERDLLLSVGPIVKNLLYELYEPHSIAGLDLDWFF